MAEATDTPSPFGSAGELRIDMDETLFLLSMHRTGAVRFFATIPALQVAEYLRRIASELEAGGGTFTLQTPEATP